MIKKSRLIDIYALSRKKKVIQGVPPLTFKTNGNSIKNYRIYGNTISGESVGDKTENLFDGVVEQGGINTAGSEVASNYRLRTQKITMQSSNTYTMSSNLYIRLICTYNNGVFVSAVCDKPTNATKQFTFTMPDNANQIQIAFKNSSNDNTSESAVITTADFEWGMLNSGDEPLNYEPYGYRVPVTVEGKNLFDESLAQNVTEGAGVSKWVHIQVGEGNFTLSTNMPNVAITGFSANLFLLSGNVSSGANSATNGVTDNTPITVISSDGYVTLGLRNANGYNPKDYHIMLNSGSTALPYEPYHAPTTTNLYLPEQIKKVGDEYEYVDYAEQKQYFADGTSAAVTLPELDLFAGTNILSVETEVQPSKISIKY